MNKIKGTIITLARDNKGDRLLLTVNRQAPLGNEKWQVETATRYGMLSTLNQRRRLRKDI